MKVGGIWGHDKYNGRANLRGVYDEQFYFSFAKLILKKFLKWFLPRNPAMLGRSWVSVCPSHACALWRNERTHYRHFDTIWKGDHSSFLAPRGVIGRCPLLPEICAQNKPLSKNADFDNFRSYHLSRRANETVQLLRIGSRPQAFQRAIDEMRAYSYP